MPLTHVCVWNSEIGYRRITVEEACKMYPYGVSASSGHFVCELCAQNVLLTAPGINSRHFRHDPSSPNKECDERQVTFDPTYGRILKSLNSHTIPLRIVVSGSTFFLELGFFPPPDSTAHCEKIKIAGESHQRYEYSFERIEQIGITYLNVGPAPSRNYWIEYVNANDELKKYWTNKAQGVSRTGTFFDCRSGQMLQPGSKAYSGNLYYLLQQGPLYVNLYGDIEVTEIAKTQTASFPIWYLYQIRIKKFSEKSAKFFLKHSVFLTERPTKFYPIWPPYIKDPYLIYHNASEFYFYLCGDDAELKSYPAINRVSSVHNGQLYKLFTREKEQLVSFGKSGALGFAYLIRQSLDREVSLPAVVVYDQSGNVLTEDIYAKLPKSKFISVSCQYDGKAVVQKGGRIEHIYRISAEQDLIIDELTFGTEICFYQGCDYIRSICFAKEGVSSNISELDDAFVKRLILCSGAMISVTHAIGTLAGKYATYPKTKQWIYATMRQGQISRKAFQLLRDNIPNHHEEG